MDFKLDVHTHTIASGHGYSTITEMAKSASEKRLSLLGITEHAPSIPGTCHKLYFENLGVVPRNMFGVELLLGAELNIIDYDGRIDLDNYLLDKLDIIVASMHKPCISPGSREENTNAVLGAIKNPRIHIIGHPDDGQYPVDYLAIVQAAKEYHTLLELNNNSLNPRGFRKNTKENDKEMLRFCQQYEVPIIINSDAHFHTEVGNHNFAEELIKEIDFPQDLIVNTNVAKLKSFLEQ